MKFGVHLNMQAPTDGADPAAVYRHRGDAGNAMTDYFPSPRDFVREQVELYEATDGAEGNEIRGFPCVVVTHTGWRTGRTRKTPLIRVTHEGRYLLIGSFGGRPDDPLWVHNIRANPAIMLRDRAQVFGGRAPLLEDPAEREAAWESAVAAYPNYATYQGRTERTIPVFACDLVPVSP